MYCEHTFKIIKSNLLFVDIDLGRSNFILKRKDNLYEMEHISLTNVRCRKVLLHPSKLIETVFQQKYIDNIIIGDTKKYPINGNKWKIRKKLWLLMLEGFQTTMNFIRCPMLLVLQKFIENNLLTTLFI